MNRRRGRSYLLVVVAVIGVTTGAPPSIVLGQRSDIQDDQPGGWTSVADPGVDNGFLWWCYSGTVDGSLFRADDGGATATSFADITPTVPEWPGRWLSGIAVDPADSNRIDITFLGFNGAASLEVAGLIHMHQENSNGRSENRPASRPPGRPHAVVRPVSPDGRCGDSRAGRLLCPIPAGWGAAESSHQGSRQLRCAGVRGFKGGRLPA